MFDSFLSKLMCVLELEEKLKDAKQRKAHLKNLEKDAIHSIRELKYWHERLNLVQEQIFIIKEAYENK